MNIKYLLLIFILILLIHCKDEKNNKKIIPKNETFFERWHLGGNDGRGQADLILYKNNTFTFSGWNSKNWNLDSNGTWKYNDNQTEITLTFLNKNSKWKDELKNITDELKKAWKIIDFNKENTSITFLIQTKENSNDKIINIFNYLFYLEN